MKQRPIKFRAWDIFKKCFIPNDVWAIVQTGFGAFGIKPFVMAQMQLK